MSTTDRIDGSQNSSKGPDPETALSSEKVGLETDIATGDLIDYDNVDAVLAAKMHLLNKAINEIGWTNYHMKLFFLNGFGFVPSSFLLSHADRHHAALPSILS